MILTSYSGITKIGNTLKAYIGQIESLKCDLHGLQGIHGYLPKHEGMGSYSTELTDVIRDLL
jgi:hypothetical protein